MNKSEWPTQWKCENCNTSNHLNDAICRDCKESAPDTLVLPGFITEQVYFFLMEHDPDGDTLAALGDQMEDQGFEVGGKPWRQRP